MSKARRRRWRSTACSISFIRRSTWRRGLTATAARGWSSSLTVSSAPRSSGRSRHSWRWVPRRRGRRSPEAVSVQLEGEAHSDQMHVPENAVPLEGVEFVAGGEFYARTDRASKSGIGSVLMNAGLVVGAADLEIEEDLVRRG